MPTIIDALVVTLGLDAAAFKRGSAESLDSVRKFRQDVTAGASDVERNARRMQEAFSGVERGIMRLSTVFLGFAGGIGFITFLTGVQKSIAELYRLGGMLGQSSTEMYKWQQVGARVGATNEEITGSYKKLSQTISDYLLGIGQANSVMRWFAQRGVQFTGPGGKIAGQTELYTQLNRAIQGETPARQESMLRNLGLGEGTVQMLMQRPEKLAADLASIKTPSPQEMKDAAIAQEKFNAAWSETLRLATKLGNIGLPIFNGAMRALVKIAEDTTREVEKITDAFNRFDKWFAGTWIGRMAAKILGEPTGGGRTSGNTWEFQQGQGGRAGGYRPSEAPVGSNSGGTTQSGTANMQGNEWLAQQRAKNMAEINNNPQLREKVLQMLQAEEGGVKGRTGAMEALLNRTAMIQQKNPNHTIAAELASGFYGPINRAGGLARFNPGMTAESRRQSESAVANAAGGSNLILGRTDQGSSATADPNARGPGRISFPGMNPHSVFNYWKGRRGGSDFTHADSERYAAYLNQGAMGSNMQNPVAAGMSPFGFASRGGSDSAPTQQSWWGRAKNWWSGGGNAGAEWGNNARAVPWLQPGGMSMIKGIPTQTYNNSSTAETHIGQFTVMTEPRSNPWSMAAQIKDAVQRSNIMDNSNSGPN